MEIVKVQNAPSKENVHNVDVKLLYDTEHAQAIHITLNPGEHLKRHITPTDVFFYVLEGRGTVEIGDEKTEVEKDTLIKSPKNIPHCWYNTTDTTLRILVVKAPRPTKLTRTL